VEHTGSWLFKRHEFIDWQQSRKPNLLWLHGIRESPTQFSDLVSRTAMWQGSNSANVNNHVLQQELGKLSLCESQSRLGRYLCLKNY